MKIAKVSERYGISTDTLRYYDWITKSRCTKTPF
jgi:DNA-binding transcriptional MerR regulator